MSKLVNPHGLEVMISKFQFRESTGFILDTRSVYIENRVYTGYNISLDRTQGLYWALDQFR